MGGNYNHGKAHYRCTFREQYAQRKGLEHPRTVYLREDKVLPALDEWLGRLFDPDHLDDTCQLLASAYEDHEDTSRADRARATITECDDRLAKYRAALEAGADPETVTSWTTDVTAEKRRAEMALRAAPPTQAPTPDELRGLTEGLGDMVAVLQSADPTKRAALYDALGLRLTFQPDEKRVLVEAQPARVLAGGVGGGTCTITPRALRPGSYEAA